MQKKNPLYSVVKEDTVWSMGHFNKYVNETFMLLKDLPEDWVLNVFTVSFFVLHVGVFYYYSYSYFYC